MRDLDIGNGVIVPAALLRASTSRSGGPGGQNVNKVESRVTIEVDVDAIPVDDAAKQTIRTKLAGRINRDGVLHVTSQAERSQLANRDRALTRLEELLHDALIPEKPRRKTRVTKAQKAKRLDNKRKHGEKKKLRRL
jgi:ribosome-associated protein